ncbi:MAG TPA: UbiA family prenyltransferase [Xenococcaceae cyanobacterium]
MAKWLYNCFLRLLIYPSIWVAAAIASLGIFTQEILELGHNWDAIALIFFTALIPYNLDRIFDSYVQKIPDNQAQLFFRQPCIWVLLLTAIAASGVLLYNAPLRVRYVSIAGIVPLLYGTPLFPKKNESGWQWYRLKDLPGSKAWIVGSVLTYAVIALPLAYAGANFDIVAALTTIFMFVFIVTNSHTFDIRDLESDRKKGVVTLPIMLGIRGTKIALTAMNLLMLLTIIGAWITDTLDYHPEIIIATVINLIYIWQVNIDTPRWVYNILLEGFLFVPTLGNWLRR